MASVLDVARPRVCSVPGYVSTSGQEVIDFAASCGLILDPWQEFCINQAYGERADGKWASFEVAIIVSRQNGKGSILEAMELAGLFLFNEQMILHSAHEFKTAAEAFRRIRHWVDNVDHLRSRVARVRMTTGEEAVELRNGNRLRFVARSTGSGRGFTGDRIVMDEAFALTPAHIEALLPTLSARPNPQLVYTSSAGMTTSLQLWQIRQRGLKGDDPSLCYLDYGAADDANLDDREVWRQSNPALGIRISEEFIERERTAMSSEGFGRERLGIWPRMAGEEWQTITAADWHAACDPDSKIDGAIALGIEVSYPDRAWGTIAASGFRVDGKTHVEIVDHRQGTGWILERVKELVDRHDVLGVFVDPGSLAGSLIPDLESAGVTVTRVSAREVAQASGSMFDAVAGDPEARDLVHIGQVELNQAVAGVVKRALADGWTWDRRNASTIISPLVAVTLSKWGFDSLAQAATPFFGAWR